jgi:hypothetical protein
LWCLTDAGTGPAGRATGPGEDGEMAKCNAPLWTRAVDAEGYACHEWQGACQEPMPCPRHARRHDRCRVCGEKVDRRGLLCASHGAPVGA